MKPTEPEMLHNSLENCMESCVGRCHEWNYHDRVSSVNADLLSRSEMWELWFPIIKVSCAFTTGYHENQYQKRIYVFKSRVRWKTARTRTLSKEESFRHMALRNVIRWGIKMGWWGWSNVMLPSRGICPLQMTCRAFETRFTSNFCIRTFSWRIEQLTESWLCAACQAEVGALRKDLSQLLEGSCRWPAIVRCWLDLSMTRDCRWRCAMVGLDSEPLTQPKHFGRPGSEAWKPMCQVCRTRRSHQRDLDPVTSTHCMELYSWWFHSRPSILWWWSEVEVDQKSATERRATAWLMSAMATSSSSAMRGH